MVRFLCDLCGKDYKLMKILYEHKRKVHRLIDESSSKVRNIECSLCLRKVLNHAKLRLHMREAHNVMYEVEELSFQSLEDFNLWKTNEEKRSKSSYVAQTGVKVVANGKKLYLYCHREGHYVDKLSPELRKKKMKSRGSVKCNSTCPSSIEVLQQDTGLSVIYYKTHSGHDVQLGHQILAKHDRLRIAGLINSGVSYESILDAIRKEASRENFSRIDLITRKDLRNIAKDFSLCKQELLKSDVAGCPDDGSKVSSIYEERSSTSTNYVSVDNQLHELIEAVEENDTFIRKSNTSLKEKCELALGYITTGAFTVEETGKIDEQLENLLGTLKNSGDMSQNLDSKGGSEPSNKKVETQRLKSCRKRKLEASVISKPAADQKLYKSTVNTTQIHSSNLNDHSYA